MALLAAASLSITAAAGVVFAAPAQAAAGTAPAAAQSATQQAAATGKAVEVADLTTATQRVLAEPDGTFTLTSYRLPVRVRRGHDWVPIDTKLQLNADGSYSPAATDVRLTFSGGGSGPALVMGTPDGHASVSISWPAGLPAPTVAGSTASYANVLPGVDLVLTARDESYSETIVVHDAQAAANPDLQNLRLTFAAHGAKLSKDARGILNATDSSGAQVFSGTTPVAWDSSYDPHVGAVPTASAPGGSAADPISLTIPTVNGTTGTATGTATVQTPRSLLIGPGVHYPVFIDPTLTWGGANDHSTNTVPLTLTVSSGPTSMHSYNNGDGAGDLKVGDCNWGAECNNIGVARAFFAFNISGLRNSSGTATVYDATVQAYQIHNADGCTAEPVNLSITAGFTSSTTWPGPAYNSPGIGTATTAYGDSCSSSPPGYDTWSSAYLASQVQSAANSGTAWMTFGLQAPNEGDRNQWKRFDLNPLITVHYSFAPTNATATGSNNFVSCNGVNYSNAQYPVFKGSAQDNNGPHTPLTFRFYLYDSGGTQLTAGEVPNISMPNGADSTSWQDSLSTTVGTTYQYAVGAYVKDTNANAPAGTNDWGTVSSKIRFIAAWSPPTSTPEVNSIDFPPNTWGNTTGSLLLRNDDPSVAGFSYAFDSGTPPTPNSCVTSYSPASKSGFVLTATSLWTTLPVPTALGPGRHTIDVRVFNGAHLLGTNDVTYTFQVSPNTSSPVSNVVEAESSRLTWSASSGDTAVPMVDLTRWSNGTDQGDVAGPGSIPGYTRQAALARIFASQIPGLGMNALYDCTKPNGDRITSLNPTCSGNQVNGLLGYVYGYDPSTSTDPGYKEIYRCLTSTDAYDTNNGCPAGATTNVLGWALTPIPSQTSPEDASVMSRSGGEYVHLTRSGATNPSQFTIGFTAPIEADYAISAGLVKGPHDGQIQYSIAAAATPSDQTALRMLDSSSGNAMESPALIGGVHLSANTAYVLTGTSVSGSAGYDAEFDYLSIAPINNFVGKPNNIGITAAGDSSTNAGLNPDPTTPGSATQVTDTLSQEALAAAGYVPGQDYTTMTGSTVFAFAKNAAHQDNISADSSTVALNTPITSGSSVDVLVLAAGGDIPTDTDYLEVNYQNGHIEGGGLPEVPDWKAAAATPAPDGNISILPDITLHTYNSPNGSGAMAAQTGDVQLYVLHITLGQAPTDTNPVVSITLPAKTTDSAIGQLHILGIGLGG